MEIKKLRFRARGSARVQDFERLDQGVSRFLGWRFVNKGDGTAVYEDTEEVAEVPFRAEYVHACREGDLWPADLETARACGVPFDPKFGAAAPDPNKQPAVKAEKVA